jgi:hypothetical protein
VVKIVSFNASTTNIFASHFPGIFKMIGIHFDILSSEKMSFVPKTINMT